MEHLETVCPYHALLAERNEVGDIIRSQSCFYAGCDNMLEQMFQSGACWPIDDRPEITEEMLEEYFAEYSLF